MAAMKDGKVRTSEPRSSRGDVTSEREMWRALDDPQRRTDVVEYTRSMPGLVLPESISTASKETQHRRPGSRRRSSALIGDPSLSHQSLGSVRGKRQVSLGGLPCAFLN